VKGRESGPYKFSWVVLLAEGGYPCNCFLDGDCISRGGWPAEGSLRVLLRRRDCVGVGEKLFGFVLWIINSVSANSFGDVLGVRSTREGISTFVYIYKREVFFVFIANTHNLVKWAAGRGAMPLPCLYAVN